MFQKTRAVLPSALVLLAGLLWAPPAVLAQSRTYRGPDVHVGKGEAHVVVLADAKGRPTSFGVELTADALQGLPTTEPSDPFLEWHFVLPFPKDAPTTGFDHVMMNWHPHGHIPEKVYTVPHMDFHFYTVDVESELAIRYAHPGMPDPSDVVMPGKDLVPAGYIIPPGTQINEEGLHALSGSAPELNGKPFTHTLIYGFHKGRLVFVEPMMTTAFLATRPNVTVPMATPTRYSSPGWYPSRYRVSWNGSRKVYRVMLDGLKPWQAGRLTGIGAKGSAPAR